MIAITANVPDSLIGRDAFQEICITGVTMPVTKHTFFVNRIEDLADALRNAFRIANSDRKGPVLIDITRGCHCGRRYHIRRRNRFRSIRLLFSLIKR